MRRAGFTLIEILVVLVIISIVTSVALLKLGQSKSKQYVTAAHEIAELLTLAQEKAIVRSQVLRVEFQREGLIFFRYNSKAQKEEDRWEPLAERLLTTYRWPDGMAILAQPTNIIISPSGDLTAFNIAVGGIGSSPALQINGYENGAITIQQR